MTRAVTFCLATDHIVGVTKLVAKQIFRWDGEFLDSSKKIKKKIKIYLDYNENRITFVEN
jgi:hypothetical protein